MLPCAFLNTRWRRCNLRRIGMKRILIVCAALLLCGVAAARGRGVHRVASCNIRVALPQDEEGGNGWSARKYVCERVMKRCKADIYCLQEVTVGQYEDMCRMFPGYFVFGYPGPETDALPDREYHGIAKNLVMFSKRRYEMTGAGVYWLSDTPLVGGSSSWGARAMSIGYGSGIAVRGASSGCCPCTSTIFRTRHGLRRCGPWRRKRRSILPVCRRCWPGISIPGLRTPLPGCLSVPAGSMRSSRPMAKMRSICRSTGSRAMPISRRRGRPGVSTTFS